MAKRVTPNALLKAARADTIPPGSSGLWFITKVTTDLHSVTRCDGKEDVLPPGTYTHLFRVTEGTLHQEPPGTCVMEDTPFELKKHLSFMLQAHGRVLVTGLGLGCVVRGLLANPNVDHVTCIERSSDVLKLVEPYMPQDRLTIIQADALEWTKTNEDEFDFGWHDIWTDRDKGEPHLDLRHTHLIFNCLGKVGRQGVWNYNRTARRLISKRIKLIA